MCNCLSNQCEIKFASLIRRQKNTLINGKLVFFFIVACLFGVGTRNQTRTSRTSSTSNSFVTRTAPLCQSHTRKNLIFFRVPFFWHWCQKLNQRKHQQTASFSTDASEILCVVDFKLIFNSFISLFVHFSYCQRELFNLPQ